MHVNKLSVQGKTAEQSQDVWINIRTLTEQSTQLNRALEFIINISDILTEGFIEAASVQIKHNRQISLLESKVASAGVDYESLDKI